MIGGDGQQSRCGAMHARKKAADGGAIAGVGELPMHTGEMLAQQHWLAVRRRAVGTHGI